MSTINYVLLGTGLAFLGTFLGSSVVLFFKKVNKKIERFCFGFAAGVMMAASVWSLILPAFEMASDKILFLAIVGIGSGAGFILILDRIIPHLHVSEEKPEGIKTKLEKAFLLVLTVTLHNIPEGMAVGVAFAVANNSGSITLASAFALAVGMCIQNIPEGAAVALPIKQAGKSKKQAFLLGTLTGIVEPIFGVLTVIFLSYITPILPFFLVFAAGAMIYVVVEELIPGSHEENGNSNIGVISFIIGFIIMLVLDITLG